MKQNNQPNTLNSVVLRCKWGIALLVAALIFWSWPKLYRVPAVVGYYGFLRHFGGDDPECFQDLERHAIIYQKSDVPPSHRELGCFLQNGTATVAATNYAYINPESISSPSLVGSCAFVRALHEFDDETIQPLAKHYYNQNVVRVLHKGSYSCRTQKNAWILSEHSYGLALDLSEFVLEDKTRISAEEYANEESPHYAFLHDIAKAACDKFGTVLTARFNEDHRDHFHISMGLFGKCVY